MDTRLAYRLCCGPSLLEVAMSEQKPRPKKRTGKSWGRFSAARKAEAVRRLVVGLDALARAGGNAATLAEWRESSWLQVSSPSSRVSGTTGTRRSSCSPDCRC